MNFQMNYHGGLRAASNRPTRSPVGLFLLFFALTTWAQGLVFAAAPAVGTTRFATVVRIKGVVLATHASGERNLKEGDVIAVGEKVRTDGASEALLKTEDAGFVAVRPGAEFVAERFVAEGKPTDSFAVRLLNGSLRVVTGWIGRVNRAEHTVITPSATIGIRGTDHEPYVLSPELAASTKNLEGTYDKVNRGGTTISVDDKSQDIDPGQVGFVRARKEVKETKEAPPTEGEAKRPKRRERALLTILLPVLLDKVPDFFVPGQFDEELDRLSQTAEADSQKALEQRRATAASQGNSGTAGAVPATGLPASGATRPATKPTAGTPAPAASPAARPVSSPVTASSGAGACDAASIAKAWLGQLDGAIARRDAGAVLELFADEASVRATVKESSGKEVSVDMKREEMVQSTLAALKGLSDYTQRRTWTEARPADAAQVGDCSRIQVKSIAIEQGRQLGKPYRFEAMEEYLLEMRNGTWRAIKAVTTQR